MARTYATRIKASEAWLRRAKFSGVARVLGGGGWWQIGSSAPIQGHQQLSKELLRRNLMAEVGSGFEIYDEPRPLVTCACSLCGRNGTTRRPRPDFLCVRCFIEKDLGRPLASNDIKVGK